MKSIKLLLAAIAILAGSISYNASAQCVASFTYDTTATFTGTLFTSTYNNVGSTYYTWSFPGGTPSSASGLNLDSTVVSYPSTGWYNVCLIVQDSAASCTDTLCDSIWVITSGSGLSSSVFGVNTSCGGCNGSASVTASGGAAPYSYVWSNGATSSSITNLCAGLYSVTVTDNNGLTTTGSYNVISLGGSVSLSSNVSNVSCNSATLSASASGGAAPYTYTWYDMNGMIGTGSSIGVFSSGFYSLDVTDANGCTGYDSIAVTLAPTFTATVTSADESCVGCCDGTASVSTTGGSGTGFTYAWSNGMTTSQISGLCPGTYSVYVIDSASNCTDSLSVTIGAYVCPTLSGQITQGTEATRVYLIEENGGLLQAVDSTLTDSSGNYSFSACPGTYYVKAALLPGHSQFAFFLPTYYVNSSLWGAATAVVISGNTSNININMLTGLNTGGPGFIAGNVSQGAGRGNGVAGVKVVLRDLNDELHAFTTTDTDGNYEFDNIAYGEYKIDVDYLNYESFPFMIELSEANPELVERNFKVEGGEILPQTPSGMLTIAEAGIEIYPNPALDVVNIAGEVQTVELYNILGEQIMTINANGSGMTTLDVSNLPAGQYVVHTITETGGAYAQIILK